MNNGNQPYKRLFSIMGPALDDDDDDDELLFQFTNLRQPIFTALHLCTVVLARSKMSVHMSVCLSVQRVTCDKKDYCSHFYTV